MYLRNERIDGVKRLRYLKKFTGGEAEKAIEGHFMSNTEHAYAAARQLLKERYGNKQILARSFRDQLSKWPSVSDDGKTLLEFSDFLGHLLSAQSSVHFLRVLDGYSKNENMCRKLPRLKWKWARIVAKTEESYYRYPTFKEFCSFVKKEAKIGQLPLPRGFNSKTKLPDKRLQGPGQSRNTFSTAIDKGCVHCKLDNHQVSECRKLQRLPKAEKSSTIRQLSLCFKCVFQDTFTRSVRPSSNAASVEKVMLQSTTIRTSNPEKKLLKLNQVHQPQLTAVLREYKYYQTKQTRRVDHPATPQKPCWLQLQQMDSQLWPYQLRCQCCLESQC
ncbi:uncharacterized protein [Watersipora subatra]|uniref:uncharacterized protein n=1 Tax=Watersipora subatra TaxID=2589382 RepID=UPI00355B9AE9